MNILVALQISNNNSYAQITLNALFLFLDACLLLYLPMGTRLPREPSLLADFPFDYMICS